MMIHCLWYQGSFYNESSLAHTGQPGLVCCNCGRSDDLRYELKVIVEQWLTGEHTGQHTYGSSAEYSYRRRRGLPPVGKKGRSGRRNKWE